MVTKERQDIYLAWDAFLEQEAVRINVRPEDRERWVTQHRKSIAAFREFEWPAIKQALLKDFGMSLAHEPHWTDPGAAVFWHEEIVKVPEVVGKSPSGAAIRELKDVNNGWKPTSPQPANNAWQIANTLRKGFRLRPPQQGMTDKALLATVPAESLTPPTPAAPSRTFVCERHGAGERRVFSSWKGYVQHCSERREVPEETPPDDVLADAKKHPYYCWQHFKGFDNKRLAERHLRGEMAKPGRSVHLSVEQMQQKTQGD